MWYLQFLVGVTNLWHCNSIFACCWCECPRERIANFSIPKWEFRDIEHMKRVFSSISHLALSTRKAKASQNGGVYSEPLFNVPVWDIIPCNLHMTMSLVKLLRHQLMVSIDAFTDAQELLEKALTSIRIKIYTPEDKAMTLAKRLEKTKFSRVNSIALLKKRDTILACLEPLKKNFPNRVTLTHKVWNQANVLLAVASGDKFELNAEQWQRYAAEFAENLVTLYSDRCVTSYLHCFVYHYGYWLEKFGGLEKLGNYSVETNVKWMKDNYARASNHGGGRRGTDAAPLAQLLSKHFRMQQTFKAALPRESQKSWTRTLDTTQTLSQFFQTDIPPHNHTEEEATEPNLEESGQGTRS